MYFKNLNKIILNKKKTIRDILKNFNTNAKLTDGKGFAIIVDDQGKICGVLTDGDLRNLIVKNKSLEQPVENFLKNDYVFVRENENLHQIIRKFDKGIKHIPIVDLKDKPIDLIIYSNFNFNSKINKKTIKVRAPHRISFSGGGFDFTNNFENLNSLVLSTTINSFCTTSITLRSDKKIFIFSRDLNKKYNCENISKIKYNNNLDVIKAAVKLMKPSFGFNLETYSDINSGTGLGGSSALAVSVIAALNYFRNDHKMNLYQIADMAYKAERIELSILGGWQDQYASTFGGFNLIEFEKKSILVNSLNIDKGTILELENNLLFFKIGSSRNSSKIQKKITRINFNEIKKYNIEMNNLTLEMKKNLQHGNLTNFGKLLDQTWQLKKQLNRSVSNKRIDKYYNDIKKLGAYGGKLLGAGSSGYLMIYSEVKFQNQIIKYFKKINVEKHRFNFTYDGLEEWSTELVK